MDFFHKARKAILSGSLVVLPAGIVLFGLFVLINGILNSLLSGCGEFLCGNTVSETVVSPDGNRKAVIFQRDCGATTGFSTQVSVLSAKEETPTGSGNVFAENTGASIFVVWKDNQTLHIHHRPTPFHSEKQISVSQGWLRQETVKITYDP